MFVRSSFVEFARFFYSSIVISLGLPFVCFILLLLTMKIKFVPISNKRQNRNERTQKNASMENMFFLCPKRFNWFVHSSPEANEFRCGTFCSFFDWRIIHAHTRFTICDAKHSFGRWKQEEVNVKKQTKVNNKCRHKQQMAKHRFRNRKYIENWCRINVWFMWNQWTNSK